MFQEYIDVISKSYSGYWTYLKNELLHPHWGNYFYWLLGLSLFVWMLELTLPWRKKQAAIRKDFWMDGFYMFFNFFIFSLIGFYAAENVVSKAFGDFLALFGLKNLIAIEIGSWAQWVQLLVFFFLRDFTHWNVHRLLHRIPWLWQFHKVHHSVKEMGFAAHLRYHWMENVVYKTLEFLPFALIGFQIDHIVMVHLFSLAVGHLNHANLNWSYGPLKYFFNNPKMHIWHHAKAVPENHQYGVNFGLTFSFWDYIFKTAYIPKDGRDIELGFDDEATYPKSFFGQILYPLTKKRKSQKIIN